MKDRVISLGGAIDFSSSVGKGVKIKVSLPLQNENND